MSPSSCPTLLDGALDAAIERYALSNIASEHAHTYAAQFMPGGNTRTSLWSEPFPLCMREGEGCYLTDVDDHTYVDLLGEFTAGIFGHSSPVLATALVETHKAGINLSAHNVLEAKYAELLVSRFPSMDLLRFTNSGTEANLMALAVAKIYTGRSKIVVFAGGYHGGVLTFGTDPNPVDVPHDYLVLPYNDLASAQKAFANHGADIAAVLVEPMQGAGGCHKASRDFLDGLRTLCRTAGAVLIFDEVQTSRMAVGGAQQRLGVIPDMTTIGKFFGGGLAFGCFGGRREIMEMTDPSRPNSIGHAGTFNNNTLTMAAGIAAVTHYLTAKNLDALYDRGQALIARLNALFARTQAPYSVTGMGSIMNVHGVGDAATDSALRRLLYLEMLEAGYYMAQRGLIALSLAVGDKHIDGFVEALGAFLDRHGNAFAALQLQAVDA